MKQREGLEEKINYLKYVEVEGEKRPHALAMAFMKPKTEVYELSKLTTKVRNIYSFSSPMMLLPTLISSAVFN